MSSGARGVGGGPAIVAAASSAAGTPVTSSGFISGCGYTPAPTGAGAGSSGNAAPAAVNQKTRSAVRGTLSVETAGDVSLAASDETVSSPLELLPYSPYADLPDTPNVRSVRALRQRDDDETSTYSFVRKKSSYRYRVMLFIFTDSQIAYRMSVYIVQSSLQSEYCILY